MHRLEYQMLDLYHKNKNYLSGSSHLIINDISQRIIEKLNDFYFLKNIPKSYFKTYFNLTLPILKIEDIYSDINQVTDVSQLKKSVINYNNISSTIISLESRLNSLVNNYKDFYPDIIEGFYAGSKIFFDRNQILIVKNNEIIDELKFGEIDPDKGFYIQDKLHYIGKARNDTLLHLGFTNPKGIVLGYCSFSILDRNYPLLVFERGLNKDHIINMTRAFTINNSPSNLMGGLFHKSYQYIKNNLIQFEYIMTYINQNLGFEGSSFKGASYVPIGLSPMQYLYDNGKYTNRKGIGKTEYIQKNRLAVLPIVLLARGLNKYNQRNLESKKEDIILISEEDYYKG